MTLFTVIVFILIFFGIGKIVYFAIFKSFSSFAEYACLSLGMPILRTYQHYLTPRPTNVGSSSESLYMLLRRSFRRMYRTRTINFSKIWSNRQYTTSFKVLLTLMLIESTIDLLFTLARLTVYYVVCFNKLAIWLTPFTCVFLIAMLDQGQNVVPILLWWSLIGYMLGSWLLCKVFPLYERWLYHNLTHVIVSRLAGISPGRDAWKLLAWMYIYILLRAFDDFWCSHLAILKAKEIYEASGNHNFSELYRAFRNELIPFHTILEKNTVEAFYWLISQIKQMIVFLFF